MKPAEIKDLPIDEIEQRLKETKEELFNLRFQNATGQLDNYKRIGQLRKDVARMKTVLRQRELSEMGVPIETGAEMSGPEEAAKPSGRDIRIEVSDE